jgi:hypothetical protein
MARPRVVTDLQIWMLETGRTDNSLAAELGAKLQEEGHKEITARRVGRWRKGLALPRYRFLALLTELSGGRVTANGFVEARMKEVPRDED